MPNPNACNRQGYYAFKGDEGPFGSFQVFYDTGRSPSRLAGPRATDAGWYWWACSPGCLPDGDACGPFDTSEEAYLDAQDFE